MAILESANLGTRNNQKCSGSWCLPVLVSWSNTGWQWGRVFPCRKIFWNWANFPLHRPIGERVKDLRPTSCREVWSCGPWAAGGCFRGELPEMDGHGSLRGRFVRAFFPLRWECRRISFRNPTEKGPWVWKLRNPWGSWSSPCGYLFKKFKCITSTLAKKIA